MMTVQQSFLAVLNAVTTVNDRWPAVILSSDDIFVSWTSDFLLVNANRYLVFKSLFLTMLKKILYVNKYKLHGKLIMK